MPYPKNYCEPSVPEKIIAAATYVFPLIGFIYIVIAALMKKNIKSFLKFHIFQSIFLAFTIWIVVAGITFAMNLISYIPLVKNIVGMVTFLLNTPIIFGFSVVTFAYLLFIIYLIFGVIKGSYSYIPWVSNIIKANLKGQL